MLQKCAMNKALVLLPNPCPLSVLLKCSVYDGLNQISNFQHNAITYITVYIHQTNRLRGCYVLPLTKADCISVSSEVNEKLGLTYLWKLLCDYRRYVFSKHHNRNVNFWLSLYLWYKITSLTYLWKLLSHYWGYVFSQHHISSIRSAGRNCCGCV